MTPSWLPRVAGVLAVGLAALLLQPAPASAHASERSASPEAGAVLDQVPAEVAITFDSPIMDIGAALVVRDGSGADATAGAPVLERTRIVVPLRPDSGTGDFSVAYRVVSEDGHAITSQYVFTVAVGAAPSAGPSSSPPTPSAAAAPATTAATTTTPPATAPPWGLALVAAVLAVVLAAAWAVWKRRNARRARAIALPQ